MRRKRANCGWRRIVRSGVMDSVMATNRSVQSPVACSRNCVGFEPNPPVNASQTSTPSGTRQIRNTAAFVHLLIRMEFMISLFSLEILFQVHAVVEAGDLFAIAVEHLCGCVLEEAGQADFLRLAPAGVVHFRIHVGVETVFMR